MATLPRENMVTYTMQHVKSGQNAVATLRASGTEPKIKYYVEIGGKPGRPREEAHRAAVNARNAVISELLRPEHFDLSV